MEIRFSSKAITHLGYWKKTGNIAIQKKITELIAAIQEDPYRGIGKPEPLKHNLSGSWSRRINGEHRIVYQIFDEGLDSVLEIQALKGHY